MKAFVFYPELLGYRFDAIQDLAEAGFEWLSHYKSVDEFR